MTHDELKIKAIQKRVTLKEIASSIGIEYNYFIQMSNGYAKKPDDFDKRVEKFFEGRKSNE